MKLILTLSLLLFTTTSFARGFCTFKTHSKLIFLDSNKANQSNIIKVSDCSDRINQKIMKYLSSSSGTVWAEYIANEITSTRVQISPKKIQVTDFNKLLKRKFMLGETYSWRDLKLMSKKKILMLDKEDSIDFTCSNCNSTGEKSFSLTVSNPITNKHKKVWGSGKLVQSLYVYKPKSSLSPNGQALSPSLFQRELIHTDKSESYITTLEGIVFQKLTRPLKVGQALSQNHITPVQLVRQGSIAKVVLTGSNIKLEARAMPMRSGSIGDTIQLKNIITKKVIIGKVIDFNKVAVEL